MTRLHRLLGVVAIAFMSMGCGGEVIDQANEHAACVLASEPVDPGGDGGSQMEFMADALLWVRVEHGCRPCAKNLEKACTVEVEGDQIIVESTFNYEKSRRPCDAICAFISSECQTAGPVPAGSYTIVYGDRTETLEIPSMEERVCFPAL